MTDQDDPTAWRAELVQWSRDFCEMLERGWDRASAATLFERIEAQPALTENRVDQPVAEAAAEVTVYLCSFVDGDSKPNAEQRVRLDHLCSELRQALDASDRPEALPAPAGPPPRVFRVHRIVAEEAADAEAWLPDGPRLAVATLAGIEAAREALAAEQPDAVLIDAPLLRSLPQLSEAARQHSAGGWRRVLWVATGIGDDLRLRLYARRAGIDLVLEADGGRAADALLSALQRRREESYRILIVEDDRSQIAFASTLLRHQGFEVDVAESSAEALARVRERIPDLVLLDIHLPDMSGVELAQLMREQASLAHVPLVFLTGEDDVDVRAEAIAAGGDDFISKPVRPRHLIANVNSRIGRARALASAGPGEPIDASLPSRLDRLRFFEALEAARRDAEGPLAVAALALEDVVAVAERLGFVRTGELAVQIAQAIHADMREFGPGCAIGEFSRLLLVRADSEEALRGRVASLCARLESREWLVPPLPFRLRFSAGVVRCDGSALAGDAVIAAALAELERVRAHADTGLSFRALARG
jgi:DNA-binding response OmpR family regulator